jgi:hypothetical protein
MPTYSIDLRSLAPPHVDAATLRLRGARYITILERSTQRITLSASNGDAYAIALELDGYHGDPSHEYLRGILADVPHEGVPWQKRISCVNAS